MGVNEEFECVGGRGDVFGFYVFKVFENFGFVFFGYEEELYYVVVGSWMSFVVGYGFYFVK